MILLYTVKNNLSSIECVNHLINVCPSFFQVLQAVFILIPSDVLNNIAGQIAHIVRHDVVPWLDTTLLVMTWIFWSITHDLSPKSTAVAFLKKLSKYALSTLLAFPLPFKRF
jgi:hypothetical protein